MRGRTPRSTRTDTLCPYTRLFRSLAGGEHDDPEILAGNQVHIGRGAEIERPGVPDHQAAAVVVADVPAEAVEAGTAVPGPRQAGHHMRQPRRHQRGGVDHRLVLEASGADLQPRSEASRVGKECVRTSRSRWSLYT